MSSAATTLRPNSPSSDSGQSLDKKIDYDRHFERDVPRMKTNSHKSRTQDEALDDPSESEDDGDQNGDRSERERDHLLATNSDQHGLNGSLLSLIHI